MKTKLKRIQTYAPDHLHKRLEIAASHPKSSKSEVVNKALELYLSPEAESARNNPLLRRLDQMKREQENLRQRLIVLSEGHALFVRYFLTMVAPPPADKRKAMRAEGEIRFDAYFNSLKIILASKNRHLFNGIEDVFLAESDFYTNADLDALEVAPPRENTGGKS
jgi:hypothetical protein